jgi:hypothetical protein
MKNKHGRKNCRKVIPILEPRYIKGGDMQYSEWIIKQSRKFRLAMFGEKRFYLTNHKYN